MQTLHRPATRRATAVAVALYALTVTTACSPPDLAALDDARTRWAGAGYEDYAFTLTSSCGERNLVGNFEVEVADGDVVGVEESQEQPEITVESFVEAGGRTIDGYLDMLDERGDEVVEVAFDDELGFPSSIRLDPEPDAVDDEECYAISDVRALAT